MPRRSVCGRPAWQSEAVADNTVPDAREVRGLPGWARELLGVAVAVAVAIAVVAVVAASARSELLFRDADSLVTTLVIHSLAAVQPQDWAMSSVLFLPEIAMLRLLSLLGLGTNGTLALAGVVNVVALYGALRVAAGSVARARAPIAGALTGLGGFALFAASESSPSRDALELASLLTTTTYYSATVIGAVLAIGLVRRALDRGTSARAPRASGVTTRGSATAEATQRDPRTSHTAADPASGVTTRGNPAAEATQRDPRTSRRVPWAAVGGIAAVAAASVLTNPLFAAWVTVPVALVLGVVAVRERVALWLAGALIAGSLVGYVGRMPLDLVLGQTQLIANTGAGYIDPAQWLASLQYYGALLAERWSATWGAASVVAVVVLWSWSVAATILLARRRDGADAAGGSARPTDGERRAVGAAFVAACGWVVPLLVVVGAIALGTHAARYLQPVVFAPLLGLVVLPELLWRPAPDAVASSTTPEPTRARRAGGWGAVLAAGAAAVALVAAVGIGVPRISAAAHAPDTDLACVVDWTEQSGRTGAGQFWTIRLPKTHLADPRALVQVDHRLRGYAWLVNRDDFAVGEVSFLVTDAQSPPFELPGGASIQDAELISCGRYTIADFGSSTLRLGPQRS
ncbi:hypothetical protein B1729_12175 [Microbacterium sp. B35-04]|nr:hypothetical protein B1729_12175 [Microbacterium sp. B35-04]